MPLFFRRSDFLKSICARFAKATGGNIAVIFAIVLVPIIGLVGAAVDYSRVSKVRSAMLAALDSAALMVSKDVAASGNMTPAQITAKAQAYFNALYVRPEVTNIAVTASYSGTTNSTVTMTGQGSLPTQFLSVIGFPTITFNMSSTTTWGTTAMRVAMSLDNTGSMADAGKMTAMKTAAKNLITTLSGLAKNPGDVYISLIPFAKDVNVSTLNPLLASPSWVDFTDWDAANTTSSQNCVQYFLFFCTKYQTVTTTASHTTWAGCVTDRAQDYDTKNTAPTASNVQTLFPAEDYGNYCKIGNNPYLQPVTPLSYLWTVLKANIDLMQPTGNTNQPIGLAWAWQSLMQGAPMSAPAEASNVTYSKVIVHLSDGENTQNRTSSDRAQIDARQAILCTNIKAAGIRIISIQVNTDTSTVQPVMQNCASAPADFYMVTSASQLVDAFDKIGTSLTKLRIAQ